MCTRLRLETCDLKHKLKYDHLKLHNQLGQIGLVVITYQPCHMSAWAGMGLFHQAARKPEGWQLRLDNSQRKRSASSQPPVDGEGPATHKQHLATHKKHFADTENDTYSNPKRCRSYKLPPTPDLECVGTQELGSSDSNAGSPEA